jgi:hypothetical protein
MAESLTNWFVHFYKDPIILVIILLEQGGHDYFRKFLILVFNENLIEYIGITLYKNFLD